MKILLKKIMIVKITILTLLITTSTPSYSEMNPKVVALGTMAVYGTIGGLLLGVASLAFGTTGRAVSQGASIGLYTGLLFGGYVVGSHVMNKQKKLDNDQGEDYYPDTEESPYESYFFNEKELQIKYAKLRLRQSDKRRIQASRMAKNSLAMVKPVKSYYINLLSFQF